MLFVQCCSLGLQLILCITDNWLSYRATWNAQNRELALRDAGIGPYEDTNDRKALVQVQLTKKHIGTACVRSAVGQVRATQVHLEQVRLLQVTTAKILDFRDYHYFDKSN